MTEKTNRLTIKVFVNGKERCVMGATRTYTPFSDPVAGTMERVLFDRPLHIEEGEEVTWEVLTPSPPGERENDISSNAH